MNQGETGKTVQKLRSEDIILQFVCPLYLSALGHSIPLVIFHDHSIADDSKLRQPGFCHLWKQGTHKMLKHKSEAAKKQKQRSRTRKKSNVLKSLGSQRSSMSSYRKDQGRQRSKHSSNIA